MRTWAATCLLAGALALLPVRTAAQEIQSIDRIAAIVGERVILLSEIDEEINQRRGQGLQVPEDSAAIEALRRQVLEELIDDEVIYQRARSDTSITVTDQEVLGAVEEQYRQVRGQFRTDQEFRQALQGAGMGAPEEYRRWLTDKQRRSAYQQRLIGNLQQEGKLRGGTVSEAELRRAFDDATARSGDRRRPPTITFRQIVVAPRASAEARREAQRRADSVRVALEGGADFATMARRYSDDVSTRENGGDLGFFRRGVMVRQFEEVAFTIRPGVVSPLVESPFGFHIILVERVQSAEVRARHILFSPTIGEAELATARGLADSLAGLVRGGASADSLARVFGDSSEPRLIGPADRTQMDTTYAQSMATAQSGAVVGPFPLNPDIPARTRFVVAQVTDIQPERSFTFEEVRDQLRGSLLREKGIRNLIGDLRRRTYIDVRL